MRAVTASLILTLALCGCDKKPAPAPDKANAADQAAATPKFGAEDKPAEPAPDKPAPAPAEPPAVAVSAADNWVPWTHPQNLISARFPEQAKQSESEAPSPIGPVKFTMAMHAENTRAFMAAAVQYDVPAGTPFDVPKALDGARDQMLGNINAKATSEKPITLDGFDGREVEFEAPGPNGSTIRGIARVWAGATPPAGYFAAAFRMTDAPDPDFVTFLDSVHLGKAATP